VESELGSEATLGALVVDCLFAGSAAWAASEHARADKATKARGADDLMEQGNKSIEVCWFTGTVLGRRRNRRGTGIGPRRASNKPRTDGDNCQQGFTYKDRGAMC
jgi:hypothetical protein